MVAFAVSAELAMAKVTTTEISKGWTFRQGRSEIWYPANVPGVVHTDLMRNGIIADPFYRLNERAVQWVDKEDWIYETNITPTASELGASNQFLQFKGLDTYADVYLNDSLILKANNMFREWNVSVKGLLKKGANKLRVFFHSPIKVDLPKWEASAIKYEASNDQSENGGLLDRKISVFARKAGYHYGWDWGPRLVTSGIWRPIYLRCWGDAMLSDVELIQSDVSAQKASLTTVVEIQADRSINDASVVVEANGAVVGTKQANLQKGINRISLSYTIPNPKLWWCNGLGEPYLYQFSTSVKSNGIVLDTKSESIGIRSLKVVNKEDRYGRSFYFELNGRPVFMKGANYIPNDSFLPRVTDSVYSKSVLDAKNANMNMLRIWGGGIYENDIFYDLCDKNGILVWQDFMFACSLYPADSSFLENVRQEAIDNVKRLRNHACLAIWCGNNECQDAWFGWGWRERYKAKNNGSDTVVWNQSKSIYYKVLPEVVREYGAGAVYRPASPFSDENGSAKPQFGDYHFWSVWHGKEPTDRYNTFRARFFSEYGFQSFPELASVLQYAPDSADHAVESEVMMAHQRGGSFANGLIKEYLLKEYPAPTNFANFLYVGQVLQGDAIKKAIEAHRRDMPYCMGSLFWQHNDCWPVASWSSRDYYGRWKAQHYFAKKAFRDILVSPYITDTLLIKLVSDRMADAKGTLEVDVLTLDGKLIYKKVASVVAYSNTSKVVFSSPLKSLIKGHAKGDILVYCKYVVAGETYSNIGFATSQKEMSYGKVHIQREIKPIEGGYMITLTADRFARAVFLSLDGIDSYFDDNYFDILPKEAISVMVHSRLPKEEFEKQLKVTSLANACVEP